MNEDDYEFEENLSEVGFMFDREIPKTKILFSFGENAVSCFVYGIEEDHPGALQSGQYIWPAAPALCNYLVENAFSEEGNQTSGYAIRGRVLELGAGCGLTGLVAGHLSGVLEVVLTDHDPGALQLIEQSIDEQKSSLLAHCRTCYVKWGGVLSDCELSPNGQKFDVILGSDVIYAASVVRPLFITVNEQLCQSEQACFLMASSFAYDENTEQEIDMACSELKLQRNIIRCTLDNTTSKGYRIQTFSRSVAK